MSQAEQAATGKHRDESRTGETRNLTSAWQRSSSLKRKTRLTAKDFPRKTPAAVVVAVMAAAADAHLF
jgi:hypothetical protein